MIRIRVCRHADGLEISAVGHADYAEWGRDIVCAGVSALLFGYLHYLLIHLPSAVADEGDDAHDHRRRGDSGDRRVPSAQASSPVVVYRMDEGTLWVRTRGADGMDGKAWEVTQAGLALIEEAYPACVCLAADP